LRFLDRILGPRPEDGQPIVAKRMADAEPLEGTRMSLYNSQIPNWWAENVNGTAMYGTPDLASRVWVANRCQQLNAQQIASMPIEFHGSGSEPAWVFSPDPNVFPNGIGDALHAIVEQLYGWGFSCQYVTDFYADGFPRSWTVLPSCNLNIKFGESGAREYKLGETTLDARRVVQIDRNPTTAAHGTSALRAYATQAWGLLAAQNQSLSVSQGAYPQGYLKSQRKVDKEQAEALQEQWMTASARRNGAPPVFPPEIDFVKMGFDPEDLALLATQEWNARTLATAYGVPSVVLNMALQGGLTYQNPVALMSVWWLTELRPTATRIMDALSAQMLPRGSWVSVDASDILSEPPVPGDDEQAAIEAKESMVASASPSQQTRGGLRAIGGTR